MSMPPDADVVVLGGGVVGVACAHYLAQAGRRVTILDRGTIGGGCSQGNCGYVCPSHILPLAMPGAIQKTIKALFRKNSALKVRPAYLLRNLGWFLGFAWRCRTSTMLESAVGIHALLQQSRKLYDELLTEHNIPCEWDPRGLLFVFQSREAHEHHAVVDEMLRERFQMPGERYNQNELAELEPALLPGAAAGGWLYRSDAQLRPDVLMQHWRQLLETRYGVRVVEGAEFRGFAPLAGEAQAVCTTRGDFRARQFVVALGAWTPLLSEQLGANIPILPGKGYSLTMATPARAPRYPMIFEEHSVAISPFQTGYRIGSTMEFTGYDLELNPARLEYLRNSARHYLPEVSSAEVQPWTGLRPMVYDGNPIIDRSPQFKNLWLAAGHGMLGLSMATGTGQLIRDLLLGSEPAIDPAPYKLSRF